MAHEFIRDEIIEEIIEKLSGELLSESESFDIVEKLISLYVSGYRHSYSSITASIIRMERTYDEAREKEDCGRPIEWIVQNLELVMDSFHQYKEANPDKNTPTINNGFFKFYDHIMLENARLDEMSRIYDPLRKEAESLRDNINITSETAKEATDKLKGIQIEIVSVLGIFTGIVLALSGSISFSNALFSSLNSGANLNALIVCAAICGLLLFNALALIIKFLSKIIFHKNPAKMYDVIIVVINIVFLLIGWFSYTKIP